jgi:hypothetical protein
MTEGKRKRVLYSYDGEGVLYEVEHGIEKNGTEFEVFRIKGSGRLKAKRQVKDR